MVVVVVVERSGHALLGAVRGETERRGAPHTYISHPSTSQHPAAPRPGHHCGRPPRCVCRQPAELYRA
ncbi:hypothetical protein E2C01_070016 [Portunus trituberculatus]|uniref:Uncharacterized protein n=1 Tax=Portunus trituberculatus TaxID=210409 RepID=A0A5B7I062_PORTR|nr:hypothetical protein [Portunus trituberculatus]